MKKDLLVKKMYYSMLQPTLITNLVISVAAFSDSMILGNFLGESALSALAFVMPVFMLMNIFIIMIAGGGAVAVSIENGKGNKEMADKHFSMTLIMAVAVGVIFSTVCLVFMDPLIYLLGARGEMISLVKEYLTIFVSIVVLFFLCGSLQLSVRNAGRPKLCMVATLTFIVMNIVLGIGFVGFTNMGIAGAAWGMMIAELTSLLVVASHFFTKKNHMRFTFNINLTSFLTIVKNGGGTSTTYIYKFFTILVFNNIIMGVAGVPGMVVYSVITNISSIALSIFEGLSQTIQPMVSTYVGEKNNSGIQDIMKLATKSALVLCGGTIVLLEIFPQAIARIFGITDAVIVASATEGIRIYSMCMIFTCFNAMMGYYYQFIQRQKITILLIAVRELVVLVPCVIVLSSLWGLNGIWLGFVITEVIAMATWLMMAKVISKKSLGKLSSVLLLDKERDEKVLVLSILAEEAEVFKAIKEADAFLQSHHVDGKRRNRLILSIEEIGMNIVTHNQEAKNKIIEIQISLGDEIDLIIRDNCKTFDPTQWDGQKNAQPTNLGLMLVKNSANAFEYLPTIGCNRVMLKY